MKDMQVVEETESFKQEVTLTIWVHSADDSKSNARWCRVIESFRMAMVICQSCRGQSP